MNFFKRIINFFTSKIAQKSLVHEIHEALVSVDKQIFENKRDIYLISHLLRRQIADYFNIGEKIDFYNLNDIDEIFSLPLKNNYSEVELSKIKDDIISFFTHIQARKARIELLSKQYEKLKNLLIEAIKYEAKIKIVVNEEKLKFFNTQKYLQIKELEPIGEILNEYTIDKLSQKVKDLEEAFVKHKLLLEELKKFDQEFSELSKPINLKVFAEELNKINLKNDN